MSKGFGKFIAFVGLLSSLIGIIYFFSGKGTIADFIGHKDNTNPSAATASYSQIIEKRQQDSNSTQSQISLETSLISDSMPEYTSSTLSSKPNKDTGELSNDISDSTKQIPQLNVDDNYLKIKIDGIEKKYFVLDGYMYFYNDVWCLNFHSDKFSNNDSIFIKLPSNIATGDSIKITTYNPQSDGWLTMPDYTKDFIYTTDKGYQFLIDGVQDGQINVKIDKWEGRGGYVTGSIEGTLTINRVDKIKFENGTFKVKIEEKPY